jgi:hypothetical protein
MKKPGISVLITPTPLINTDTEITSITMIKMRYDEDPHDKNPLYPLVKYYIPHARAQRF